MNIALGPHRIEQAGSALFLAVLFNAVSGRSFQSIGHGGDVVGDDGDGIESGESGGSIEHTQEDCQGENGAHDEKLRLSLGLEL